MFEEIDEVDSVYDVKNRAVFTTAEELDVLLESLDDATPVYICGKEGWIQLEAEEDSVGLNSCMIEEYYDMDFEEITRNAFPLMNVSDLRYWLRRLPEDTAVYVCGLSGWFHAPSDFSCVNLDADSLEEYYDEQSLTEGSQENA